MTDPAQLVPDRGPTVAGPGTVPSPPDPVITARIADRGLAAFTEPVPTGWPTTAALLDRLAASLVIPVDDDLAAWASDITEDKGFPLLGTTGRAQPAAALLWLGTRLDRVDRDDRWAALLAGLAAADTGDLGRLSRALRAADAIGREVALLAGDPATATAWPSTGALPAAVAAVLAAPPRGGQPGTGTQESEPTARSLATALDLAATLMVLGPPAGIPGRQPADLTPGHAAAAGWLVGQLIGAGVTPMPGAVTHTVSATTGRPCPPPVATEHDPSSTVADLLRGWQ